MNRPLPTRRLTKVSKAKIMKNYLETNTESAEAKTMSLKEVKKLECRLNDFLDNWLSIFDVSTFFFVLIQKETKKIKAAKK